LLNSAVTNPFFRTEKLILSRETREKTALQVRRNWFLRKDRMKKQILRIFCI